jgi:DNA gyrase subunit A
MPSRNYEIPVAAEIKATEQQLHIFEALAVACRDPRAVFDVIAASEDVEGARRELQQLFGLDEIQSNAVLDLQYRRATERERAVILDRVSALAEQLEYLRSLDA